MAALANVYADFVADIPKPVATPAPPVHPKVVLDLRFDFRTPPPRTPTRTAITTKPLPATTPNQPSDKSPSVHESEPGAEPRMSPMRMELASPTHPDWLESLFTPNPNDDPGYFLESPSCTSAHVLEPLMNPSGTEESLSTSLSILELPWSLRHDGEDVTVKEGEGNDETEDEQDG
jgi:hypothetical protein